VTTPRQTFAELLAGMQQNKLSLVDMIQMLNARGAVQSPLHKAELAMLDDALSKKKIDEKLHRLLVGKLKDLQVPKATVEKTAAYKAYRPGAEDVTVAAGGPAAGEKTVLNPGGDKTIVAGGPDKTVLNPGGNGSDGDAGFDLLMGASDGESVAAGGAETTGFKPQEQTIASRTGSQTGTGGKPGPTTSSWQRIATQGGPEREVHAGDTLKERFYLEKEVGRGGMGIVFKSRDERKVEAQDKNPWVAVKVLNPEFRKHPQALVALQRESRKAQQLTHDNILRVYDFDKDGTVIYMTMEYVDGGSLKDVIKRHPSGMPFDKGWPIIEGLARGLGRAHRDNIVHSDFKPGNVMMTSDLIPKLFDLGIARAAKSGADSKGETTVFDAGELGALTPAYASLEMIQGQPPELIDDIYALGITAYEILTGKHPFGKKNAEEVMKSGIKPPVVPGLTRRQRKTLEASVAFKRADRVKTCDAFIEGMRKLTFKDYALPLAGAGVGVTILFVSVVFGILPYLEGRRVDGMIEQFSQSAFADPTTAVAALNAMDEEELVMAKQKGQSPITEYFFKLKNAKWDLTAKPPKYSYPEALAVLNLAKDLFPDSQRVATELSALTGEKDKQLSTLRDEYEKRLADRRIYEDKPGNVVETMTIIGQIDPNYDLFKSQTLPLEYQKDVRRSLDNKDYDAANTQIATAVKVFPGNDTLKNLASEVKAIRETEIARAQEREMREKMTAAQAKEELVKLAAAPLFTPDWQVKVNVAMSKLKGETSPETQQAKEKLAVAYAQVVAQKTGEKQLGEAKLVADAGMNLFPDAAPLMQEVAKLTEARKAYEGEQAKAAALARVDDLKSTLIAQATANETTKALKALTELKIALAPNDPFLVSQAPKAIAESFLRQAERQAQQSRFSAARQLVAEGLKLSPGNDALVKADRAYQLEGSVAQLQAGMNQPANIKGDDLKAALEVVKSQDPQRHAKLSGDLQSGVLARLQSMAQSDPASAKRGKEEWVKVFPQYPQLASLVIPEAAALAPATTATTPAPSLPQEAKRAARRAPGVDSCSPSMSTFGTRSKATCDDDVAGARGPRLVVIPSPAGGYLAVTKYEITVGQFDQFCKATGKCKPAGGNEALPRTGVSLALAKAYATWLSETTGFNYRLPTDSEWTHAANAGGQGAGDSGGFNCVVGSVKGGFAVPANSGAPNAWGLVNVVGNAAEWVEGASVRGGSFNVPLSQCTVEWKQGGSESDTVGLRLVREMG
jgi:non-specific serine/threonine protein kinase